MVNITYDAAMSLVATYDPAEEPAVYSPGDIMWVLFSAALVFSMSPGVGFLYSGLLRRKNALSMLVLAVAVYAVVSVQWFLFGYSLAFSSTGSKFIGDWRHFGLRGVLDSPSPGSAKIPSLVYCIYQAMFATVTPVLAIGGCAERARLAPMLVFVFCWATVVYDPIATWTWAPNGWAYQLGVLDFAGGGPVHVTSGTAALAISIYLGKRRGYGTERLAYRPHSVSHVILGTLLLWFGWFGFNGGSALSSNLRAAQACIATNIAAASAGLTWMFVDWCYSGHWSAVSLCTGIVVGLVGVTPAAGYIGTPAALGIGIITAVASNFATQLKRVFHYDDALDVFPTHGVGGFVGSLLTGLFADSRVTSFDGITEIPGGWINHNYRQLGLQLANAMAIVAYTFVVTMLLLLIIDFIPGLGIRVSEEAEIVGVDEDQCGETAYDFAFLNRDLEQPFEHRDWIAEKRTAQGTSYR